MGQWSRGSDAEYWSRTGPSDTGPHQNGGEDREWKVLQRQDRSMQVYNDALSQKQIKAIMQKTQVPGENAITSSSLKPG